jgi:hypothetical protein
MASINFQFEYLSGIRLLFLGAAETRTSDDIPMMPNG